MPNHFTKWFFGPKGAVYYEAIATVIFSHVKITCYFHVWRYQVFVAKLTWYFIGVYIMIEFINRFFFQQNQKKERELLTKVTCLFCLFIFVYIIVENVFWLFCRKVGVRETLAFLIYLYCFCRLAKWTKRIMRYVFCIWSVFIRLFVYSLTHARTLALTHLFSHFLIYFSGRTVESRS